MRANLAVAGIPRADVAVVALAVGADALALVRDAVGFAVEAGTLCDVASVFDTVVVAVFLRVGDDFEELFPL